ncbi:hypothetical protein POVWA2_092910 [Plasmodium ovale wallikeri]|uniref:PIR Superfamily Protein n=2 Tax=Plasmodium ovale TaxID=36330 RepID=A0A1A9ASQ2_PLAOA|nr:hypothetical protein POVWA1_068900 [Plasmodium ovale wallikeri]SBT59187.1 hypothetical protein POVWA2_092910 [Plasmodium ovale wallikeri]SBT73303.1 hypothetical protein POWCR01_000101500 [Plasmodium ovale]
MDFKLKEKGLFDLYSKFNKACADDSRNNEICNLSNAQNSEDVSIKKLYKEIMSNLKLIYDDSDPYFADLFPDKKKDVSI